MSALYVIMFPNDILGLIATRVSSDKELFFLGITCRRFHSLWRSEWLPAYIYVVKDVSQQSCCALERAVRMGCSYRVEINEKEEEEEDKYEKRTLRMERNGNETPDIHFGHGVGIGKRMVFVDHLSLYRCTAAVRRLHADGWMCTQSAMRNAAFVLQDLEMMECLFELYDVQWFHDPISYVECSPLISEWMHEHYHFECSGYYRTSPPKYLLCYAIKKHCAPRKLRRLPHNNISALGRRLGEGGEGGEGGDGGGGGDGGEGGEGGDGGGGGDGGEGGEGGARKSLCGIM
jgi:uncharacterized membrane protein YgcG